MNNQPKQNLPFKLYPKEFEDLYDIGKISEMTSKKIDVVDFSVDKFITLSRELYKESNEALFGFFVKQVWLDTQLIINGKRNLRRNRNGFSNESMRAKFFKAIVGKTGRAFSSSYCLGTMASYFPDFFPNFLGDNPFESPEKFKFPYKNITMEYLDFVAEVHCRLELLEEADKRGLSFAEFMNWSINWVMCYNKDVDDDVYRLGVRHSGEITIKNNKLPYKWSVISFEFKKI